MRAQIKLSGSTVAAGALERYLPTANQFSCSVLLAGARETAERLCETMLGPSCWRPASWVLTEENRESIIQTLERYVMTGGQIDCVSMGGATKHYCNAEVQQAETAELAWILRFARINSAVKEIYAPGIRLSVYLEDYSARYLHAASRDAAACAAEYSASLQRLARLVTGDWLSVLPESEVHLTRLTEADVAADFGLCEGKPVTWEVFKHIADACQAAFAAYLRESCEHGLVPETACGRLDGHDELASARKLAALGFSGGVPRQQRAHYIARAANRCGGELCGEAAEASVARYLATVLTRTRLRFLRPTVVDRFGEIPPLKLSLMGAAPGSPAHLERRRFEYLAHDRTQKSRRTVVPWSGTGVVSRCGGGRRFTIAGFRTAPTDADRQVLRLQTPEEEAALSVLIEQ